MSDISVRVATPGDIPAIVQMIATLNVEPQHRCLHCDEDADSIIHSMEQLPPPPESAFVVAEQGGSLVGVLGCDASEAQGRGWLWGPFVTADDWDDTMDHLYTHMANTLSPNVRQLDNFLDLANQRSITALERQGFVVRGLTHVYEAIRPQQSLLAAEALPDLDDADADAFIALHDTLFPGTYNDGATILRERDADHRVFAYRDGELLGYIYATPADAADSGYVHYVGVREDARGRGIGRRLVLAALRWLFEERGFGKVSLTVADTHEQARALYERTGFGLLYTGVGQRKTW